MNYIAIHSKRKNQFCTCFLADLTINKLLQPYSINIAKFNITNKLIIKIPLKSARLGISGLLPLSEEVGENFYSMHNSNYWEEHTVYPVKDFLNAYKKPDE